jgi:hypothetical protein
MSCNLQAGQGATPAPTKRPGAQAPQTHVPVQVMKQKAVEDGGAIEWTISFQVRTFTSRLAIRIRDSDAMDPSGNRNVH